MNTIPLISICIPTYNNELFIQRTLDSIQKQTIQDFEVIICDDNSTDRTIEIVKSIEDDRIKIFVNSENIGVFENWTKAIYYARGKYIKLVCGDDTLASECLKKQVEVFENDKDQIISLVSVGSQIITENDIVQFKRKSLLKTGLNNSLSVIQKCILFGTNLIGEPMVGMFRSEILQKKIIYGSNMYLIDLDFWFKLLKFGDLYFINENLASFRISNNSLSSGLSFKQARLFREFALNKYKEYRFSIAILFFGYINSYLLAIVRNFIFAYSNKKWP